MTGGQDHQDGQESHEDLEAQAKGKASQVSAATLLLGYRCWCVTTLLGRRVIHCHEQLVHAGGGGGGEGGGGDKKWYYFFVALASVCVCVCVCVCVYMHALCVHAGVELMNIR